MESKTGSAKQTKAQKKFQEDVEKDGGNYIVKRQRGYDDLFDDSLV